MITLASAQLWVHDQDEALTFYTQKLGMEVRADVTLPEMGDFRWLSVGPVGQPDVAIVLMTIPGPPVMDPESAEQVRSLMAKGFAGTIFLATDDCQAAYEELKGRGVQFVELRRSARTGSTRRSVTRRATTSGSPRSGRWRESEQRLQRAGVGASSTRTRTWRGWTSSVRC